MQMYPSEFHILPQWIIYEKTRMSQKINLHEATITLESVLESSYSIPASQRQSISEYESSVRLYLTFYCDL